MFSLLHLIRQIATGVMKVTGLDFDIRVEGVLVEKHRAASAVGNMEPVFFCLDMRHLRTVQRVKR